MVSMRESLLQEHIESAIAAAEHGSDDHIQHAVNQMTHSKFADMPITFDLRERPYAMMSVAELREAVSGMGVHFQSRVTILEKPD